MAVKKVTTLGCNPLLMLHKMGDAGGLEILESESFDRWGTTYYTRVVGRHSNGLYFEAKDGINATLGAESERRLGYVSYTYTNNSVFPSDTILPVAETVYFDAQEMAAGDFARTIPLVSGGGVYERCYSFGIFAPDQPTLASSDAYTETVSNMAISSMFRALTYLGRLCSGNYNFNAAMQGGGGIIDPFGQLPNSLGVVTTNNGGSGYYVFALPSTVSNGYKTLLSSSEVYGSFAFRRPKIRQIGNYCDGAYEPVSSTYPFVSPDVAMFDIFTAHAFTVQNSPNGLLPICASGGAIRVALSIDGEGNLNNPSEWTAFPIHCECMSTDSGLWFINAGTSTAYLNSSYSFIGLMDTSVGNNFGDGAAPVMMRQHKLSAGVYRGTAPYARGIGQNIVTDGLAKTLTQYAPTIPIASDIYSGGPVVGNIFGHTVDEVRGVYPDLLSCSSSLAIGTSGWLDGKRYSVFKPGYMIRVG
jgi:hypothetical protein